MKDPQTKQPLDDTLNVASVIEFMYKAGMHEQAKQTEALQRELLKKGKAVGQIGSVESEQWLDKFITQDKDMLELKSDVRKLVESEESVLILGETGTGKELIARALHGSRGPLQVGNSNVGRFVAVNCTSLSNDLMASELFGHVAGAFTGATNDRVGKLQYAAKGTLFIDEIGDMSLEMQSALLRALQERKVIRVGDNKEIDVDFRLVCATHRHMGELIRRGEFRQDLYYRISTFELQTKPLRDRRSDIQLILKSLDPDNKANLTTPSDQDWMGNVRELQRAVKRSLLLKK